MSVDTSPQAKNEQYVQGGLYTAFAAIDKQHFLIVVRDHLLMPDAPTILHDEIGAAETWLSSNPDARELPLIARFDSKELWLGHVVRSEIEPPADGEALSAGEYAAKVLSFATFKTPSLESAITSFAGSGLLESIKQEIKNKQHPPSSRGPIPMGNSQPWCHGPVLY